MIRCRTLLAATATIAAAALLPSAAGAVGVTATTTPASTAAGANSAFTLGLQFQRDSIDDTPKDLTIQLPPGLVGSAVAADVCDADTFRTGTCPASAQVGTAQAEARATGIQLPAQASGEVFSITPSGSEPVRLGIVLRVKALGLPLGKLRSESAISLRPADGGLTSTVEGLPNKYLGLKTALNSLTLTLDGQANGKPFLRNPTSCGAATTNVSVSSHKGASSQTSASFTPTGCDALDFSPALGATVTGNTTEGSLLGLDAIVSQDTGEAGAKTVAVTLPYGTSVNLGRLNDVCPEANVAAGTCPDSSIVGSAQADVPILPQPLKGPVRLIDGGGDLPSIELDLKGAVDLKLRGAISVSPDGRLVNTFDGIPDVPLSRFSLSFAGGPNAALLAGADLCAGAGFDAAAVSQAGVTRAFTAPTTFPACSGAKDAPIVAAAPAGAAGSSAGSTPGGGVAGQEASGAAKLRLGVSLTRVGGERGKQVGLKVSARATGEKLRRVSVALPKGLTLATKRIKAKLPKGASLKGSSSRTLRITLPKAGVSRLTVQLTRGVSASESLREASKSRKLTFRSSARYADGGTSKASTAVRTKR